MSILLRTIYVSEIYVSKITRHEILHSISINIFDSWDNNF